jgi:hypothetical protein
MTAITMEDDEYAIAARGKLYRIRSESPLAVQVLLRLADVHEESVLIGRSGQVPTSTQVINQAILDQGVKLRDNLQFDYVTLWNWLDSQAVTLAATGRTMRPVGKELKSASEFEAYCRTDDFMWSIVKLAHAMHLKVNGRRGKEPSRN